MNMINMQAYYDASRIFTPAAPVREIDLFAGRLGQIENILSVTAQPGQHVIIFGERGVGKTSLANVLNEFLARQGQGIICVRVNADTSDTFKSIFEKVFSDIKLTSSTRKIGFETELDSCTTPLSSNITGDMSPTYVRKLLEQIGSTNPLIIIIDEFDRINPGQSVLFSDFIKSLSDYVVNATVILVGVADSVDDLVHGHESIERALVQVPMPRMIDKEVEEIVIKGLSRLSLDIDSQALAVIVSLTQGLPHYAHLLGLNSVYYAVQSDSPIITQDHVNMAITKALDSCQQSIKSAYAKAVRSPRKENLFAEVLLACALSETDELGYFTPASVKIPMSKIMGRNYEIPGFARHLSEFTSQERGPILQQCGTRRKYRYRFVNPLLQPYVIMLGISNGMIDENKLKEFHEG